MRIELSVRGNRGKDHMFFFESCVGLRHNWYELRANVRLLLFLSLPTLMGATEDRFQRDHTAQR